MSGKRNGLDPPRITWLIAPKFDDDGVQVTAGIDQFGREHLDPVPMSPPVGLQVSQGDELHSTLRRLVHEELFARAVAEEGFETFEEAEDFDVEDDYFPVDPHTPWEAVFDPPPPGAPQASQKASGDSVSSASPEKKVEKPSESVVPPSSGGKTAGVS